MTNRLKKISENPFVLNTAKLSASNIIMYLLPVVVTPILSRVYTPTDFGEWGIFSSWFSILSIGIFLGFENYIVKAKEEELQKMIQLCFIISITSVIVLSILFSFLKHIRVPFIENIPTPHLLFFLLLVSSFNTIFYNICNKKESYTSLSLSNLLQGVSQALFRILFGLIGFTINGLILGTTGAYLVAGCFLLYCVISKGNLHFKYNVKTTKIRDIIYKYKNASLYDAPSSILSFAAFNLPIIILANFYDKNSIGCFSMILQLLLLPISFLGSAIGKVFYQQLCKNEEKGETNKIVTNKVAKILIFISITPLFFIVCGGDKIIVWILGNNWKTAGDIALCLSLWSFPIILTQPLLPIFRVLNKQRILLYYDITYFIGCIGTIFLGGCFSFNLYAVLITYSIVCFIVKFKMFCHILSLSNLKISTYKKVFPIWIILLGLLILRIFTI